jgi:hypothetical protein
MIVRPGQQAEQRKRKGETQEQYIARMREHRKAKNSPRAIERNKSQRGED